MDVLSESVKDEKLTSNDRGDDYTTDSLLNSKESHNAEEEKDKVEAEEGPVDMTFTKELRQATKDVHKLSDVLVNAKFALALNDDRVWADGLLAFHEIYRYLENNLPVHLLPKELHRTAAFEKDLAYFFGENWKDNYKPRESVQNYLKHLDEVRAKGNIFLFAYAFQMYMALMSGGQLLQKKRMIQRKLWNEPDTLEEPTAPADPDANPGDLQSRPMPLQVPICPEGCASTYFPEKISTLKDKLRRILNQHYPQFDSATREQFIQESRNVFTYNIEVVRSIKGVNAVMFRRIALFFVAVAGLFAAVKFAKR